MFFNVKLWSIHKEMVRSCITWIIKSEIASIIAMMTIKKSHQGTVIQLFNRLDKIPMILECVHNKIMSWMAKATYMMIVVLSDKTMIKLTGTLYLIMDKLTDLRVTDWREWIWVRKNKSFYYFNSHFFQIQIIAEGNRLWLHVAL